MFGFKGLLREPEPYKGNKGLLWVLEDRRLNNYVFTILGAPYPEGPYTLPRELGPKKPSLFRFWGPNSIIVVYVGPSRLLSF